MICWRGSWQGGGRGWGRREKEGDGSGRQEGTGCLSQNLESRNWQVGEEEIIYYIYIYIYICVCVCVTYIYIYICYIYIYIIFFPIQMIIVSHVFSVFWVMFSTWWSCHAPPTPRKSFAWPRHRRRSLRSGPPHLHWARCHRGGLPDARPPGNVTTSRIKSDLLIRKFRKLLGMLGTKIMNHDITIHNKSWSTVHSTRNYKYWRWDLFL